MGYRNGEGDTGWDLLHHVNPFWVLAALAAAGIGGFAALNSGEVGVICDAVTGCLDTR